MKRGFLPLTTYGVIETVPTVALALRREPRGLPRLPTSGMHPVPLRPAPPVVPMQQRIFRRAGAAAVGAEGAVSPFCPFCLTCLLPDRTVTRKFFIRYRHLTICSVILSDLSGSGRMTFGFVVP